MKTNFTRRNLFTVFLSLSTFFMVAQTTVSRSQNDQPEKPTGKYAKLIQAVIDSYDQVEGAQSLEQKKILHAQKTSELQSTALRMNIPIQRINENGTVSLLIAFLESDKPLYYSIENVDAAESTRTDHLNSGGSLGFNLNGDDLTAHVWDGGPVRPTHQEFDGTGGTNRLTINDGVTTLNGNSFHAMHVSGTIGASGFQAAAKGMAWQANVLAHDWDSDDVEARAEAMNGMLLSNHSYGIPYEAVDTEFPYYPGQYNSASTEWDDIMYDYPFYLMVKSAGNDGNRTGGTAPLEGNIQFDKLTGNANAKNNLVIVNAQDANVDGSGNLISVTRNSGSSEGPTDDLRVKPDIAGNGTGLYSSYDNSDSAYNTISGTSMSAPNVTGTLLLLQEHNANVNSAFMRAATLKGLALHTADDVSGAGPDAEWGWGLLNAKAAAEAITNADAANGAIIQENTLNNGTTYSINVQSDGVNPLLASISWTDPAGTPDNSTTPNVGTPVLVHDLDITLSNGSTFYPWRLTSVNTKSNDSNSGNGNLVDPYERIDITAPAGIYTLTVSHKGTLPVAQDYSLIVTGANLAPSTPEISFAELFRSEGENSDCSFTDVTIAVNLANAASQDADVNFTINGSSTATTDVDFELMTSSVTFDAGTTTSQNMVIRVYEDDFIEADETVTIDFTVDANMGDATANTSADQFTLTITNDDFANEVSVSTNVYSEDFEDFSEWINTEAAPDSDGNVWLGLTFTSGGYTGFSGQFAASETDLTVLGGIGTTDPNNYLISPVITIPANTVNVTFDFSVAGYNNAEYYSVYWSPSTNTTTINGLTPLESRSNAAAAVGELRSISNTSINDETGHFVIRHHNSDANAGLLLFDGLVITADVSLEVQTAVNTGTPATANINDAGTANITDASSTNYMMEVVNNQADDYGCTTVAVNRAGTGAQAYNGSASPNLAMDKRFVITPTNAIGSGDTQLTFYFTAGEISGWEAVTGLSDTDLVIAREEGGAIVETSAVTLGTFGTAVTLTGDFTDLEGEYYFGSAATFVAACAGVTKTWDGTDWIPAGAPGLTNAVIIDNTYDTGLHGDINACTVTVNVTESLTVRAGDFINVVGNIVVDGTLQVDHTGSVVQTNDSATVTKGGSGAINVAISTPGLKDRDFVIMGSPLDGTMRENTLSSVWKVLANTPGNFIPHPDVLTTHGTTFADDNGNDWNSFTTGAITVGEGFIVRPVYEHGSTPIVYDYTFSEGTLNNGVVTRPMVFNGLGANPGGTPNVYANPYASAISVNDFMTVNTDVAAVFYWEHITHPSSAIDGYHSINFDMDDISIYNGAMGTPAANDLTADMPTNMMSSGQGFGVLATSTGTVTFNNSMRRTNENGEMRNAQSIIESLLLRVRNDEFGVGSYAGLAFTDFTTEGLDARYDTERITTSVSLYSHLSDGSSALAIQSRELFDANMQIPMGFVSQIDAPTEFTFSIANVLGAEVSQADVMLLDTFTGVTTNLSENDYVFTSDIGQHDGRFLIMFATEVLGTQDELLETLTVYPNPTSDVINIVSPQSAIQQVTVYDMMGRVVLQLDGANQNNVQLDLSSVNNALYFVEINTEQGVITQRIVKE